VPNAAAGKGMNIVEREDESEMVQKGSLLK
jgi:hypothetical protein